MADDTNTIEMQDEQGNNYKFEHLLTFEVEDDFYIAFTPIEKMDEFDAGEVLIMRIKEDDEHGDVYVPIETEEELNDLWEIFQQLYYEEEE
ncbi:MAG TPA: hypothetical protein DEB31_07405 [Clostridiales bacterium]|nr:hypothetical protein [Clostridiales bacterium]